jgi:hypothetical protein
MENGLRLLWLVLFPMLLTWGDKGVRSTVMA